MKKLVTILTVVLLNTILFAQSPPQMISYQAIIRNNSNALVASTQVGMQISILQTSSMGGITPVYVETQTPTTNINGLVSLQVGAGTVVSGAFSTINWANGPFYIQTDTDLTGGTNYSITGSSQLLSVPYALFAKTVGTITEADPIFAASAANGITATNISDWNNKQNVLTAGSGISISGTTISTLSNAHHVNESYGGGIVFYVYDNGQHGLIVSTADQNTGIRWSNGTFRNTGSKGDGVAAGTMNTTLIVATQTGDDQEGNFAAKVCADYSWWDNENGYYGDWYLPSLMELNLLYLQKDVIGGFSSGFYWSSTEQIAPGHYYAWGKDFDTGGLIGANKLATYKVRAIRAF